MSNLKTSVYALFDEIAGAEKITRRALGQISRELMIYVPESDDIDIVNRLLGVLTPVNRRVAILYFQHFLPWDVEKDTDGNFVRFGKKHQGEKKVVRKMALITEWLKDEANNIWVWSDTNIELKQKDFVGMISRAIKKALEGDEKTDTKALTTEQVMSAVFDGGVELGDVMAATEAMRLARAEIEERENNPANVPGAETEAQAA